MGWFAAVGTAALVLAAPSAARLPLGYSTDSSIDAGQFTPAAFAATLARGGATLARVQVDWPKIQPEEAPIAAGAFGILDGRMAALRKAGVRPLLLFLASPGWSLDFGGGLACRLRDYCLAPPADSLLDTWGAFVAATAKRYPEAAGLEIWNEPNAISFWETGPDPARYTALVCAARRAVRAAGLATPIVSGGLSASRTSPGMLSEEFLARAYDAGLGNCADGIGIHPYSTNLPPDAATSPHRREVTTIRATMRAHGDHVHKLWFTEIGWSTKLRDRVTEAQQADYLVRAYKLASASGDVAAFIVHTLIDPFVPTGGSEGHGVFTSNGTAKLAYGALRDAVVGMAPAGTSRPKRKPARLRTLGRKGRHELPNLTAVARLAQAP